MYPRGLDDIFDLEEIKMSAQLPSECVAPDAASAPRSVALYRGFESKVIRALSPKGNFLGTTLTYVFLEKRTGDTNQEVA